MPVDVPERFRRAPRRRLVAPGLLALACLAGCGGGGDSTEAETPVPSTLQLGPVAVADVDSGLPDRWYTRGAFMEINVRAYHDSDGDGIGDLNGVTQKLDYLKDLGIGGIWLMPINRTDDHDSGYIVTDHRGIETDYGTTADFKRLLDEAHRRGIGVIMDYVPNHSAASHPLFRNAASSRNAAYRNWYLLSAAKPGGWTTWSGRDPWYQVASGFYYAAFNEGMPDFNWLEPAVVEYHENSLRHWLNLGVDGFRFDAVGKLVERGPGELDDNPESMALVHRLQQVVHAYAKRYVVCENPSQPDQAAAESACGSAFAFGLNDSLRRLARGETAGLVEFAASLGSRPLSRMGTFLANHDRFAGLRLMDEFAGDETSYRLAAASLLTLPGIPFVYYGEEVGMRNLPLDASGFDGTTDWPLRGPMSWAASPSVTDNTRQGPFADFNYFQPAPNIASHNVLLASGDSASLWHFYRSLLNLRRASPALREGELQVLAAAGASLVYERRSGAERVLVVINYGSADATLSLSGLPAGLRYDAVLAHGTAPADWATPVDGSAASVSAPARSMRLLRAGP